MSDELRGRLEESAEKGNRSLHSEVVSRLEESFQKHEVARNARDVYLTTKRQLEVERERSHTLEVENASLRAEAVRAPDLLREIENLKELAKVRRSHSDMLGVVTETLAKMLLKALSFLTSEQRKLAPEVGVFEVVANGVVKGNSEAIGIALRDMASSGRGATVDSGEDRGSSHLKLSETHDAVEDATINALRVPVTVRGKSTEVEVRGDLRAPGERISKEDEDRKKPKTKWFERGFIYSLVDVTEPGAGVSEIARLTITDDAARAGDAKLIYDEIESVHRLHGDDCTVWLDLQVDHIPSSVHNAIKSFAGFGVGLVITVSGKSTLSNPESFDPEFMADLRAAYRHGRAWCPIEQKMIHLDHGMYDVPLAAKSEQIVKKVVLVGTIGRDPEIRYLPSGEPVVPKPPPVHPPRPRAPKSLGPKKK